MFLIKVISGSDLSSLTTSHIKPKFDFFESSIRDGKRLPVTLYFLTENHSGELWEISFPTTAILIVVRRSVNFANLF